MNGKAGVLEVYTPALKKVVCQGDIARNKACRQVSLHTEVLYNLYMCTTPSRYYKLLRWDSCVVWGKHRSLSRRFSAIITLYEIREPRIICEFQQLQEEVYQNPTMWLIEVPPSPIHNLSMITQQYHVTRGSWHEIKVQFYSLKTFFCKFGQFVYVQLIMIRFDLVWNSLYAVSPG